MKQITCPHCGDTYPDFDVAHVCSKGPYAPKLKSKMNERIKDLEIQCWEPRQYGPAWFNSTKFAELIVRECMEVGGPEDSYRDEWFNAKVDSVAKIKQHFGVEE